MKLIAQGAEAKVYVVDDRIRKERLTKPYRIAKLDQSLRKQRTRREAKVLTRLEENKFPAPKLLSFSDKEMTIDIEYIDAPTLKQAIDHFEQEELAQKLAELITNLHALDIVHGDLTSSNILAQNKKLILIDFGLAQFSQKVEDKAVDLFLFERALKSLHLEKPKIIELFYKYYKHQDVLERLSLVKERGRNKNKN